MAHRVCVPGEKRKAFSGDDLEVAHITSIHIPWAKHGHQPTHSCQGGWQIRVAM